MTVSAHAEFVLLSGNGNEPSSAPQPMHAQSGEVEAIKPNEPIKTPETTGHHSTPPKKPQPHRSIAHGFGTQIPLEFAVKQIVPSGFTVQFERGVNKQSPVEWHGEQTWSSALRQAVKPLELKVRIEAKVVHISKV